MKNSDVEKQISMLLSGLKGAAGKSDFVGLIIQMIGICKVNQCDREEAFDLFQKLLFEIEFDEKQSHDYLAIYVNQVNNRQRETFDLEKFQQVIFQLIQNPVVDTANSEKAEEEKLSHKEIRSKNTSHGTTELEKAASPQVTAQEEIDYEAIALADEAEYAAFDYEEDNGEDTGILDGSFWENRRPTALEENLQAAFGKGKTQTNSKNSTSYLVRENSGDEIPLNKDVFSLGKDEGSVDYVIQGNTTVSRKHAEIIKRGLHYFICDKGSTNKTYVEGKEIPPEEFVEIHNGTRIKISNEAFTFRC